MFLEAISKMVCRSYAALHKPDGDTRLLEKTDISIYRLRLLM